MRVDFDSIPYMFTLTSQNYVSKNNLIIRYPCLVKLLFFICYS